jgi:hypothetical protein
MIDCRMSSRRSLGWLKLSMSSFLTSSSVRSCALQSETGEMTVRGRCAALRDDADVPMFPPRSVLLVDGDGSREDIKSLE